MTFENIYKIVQKNLATTNYIGIAITKDLYPGDNNIVNICFYLPKAKVSSNYAQNIEKRLYQCDSTKHIVREIVRELRNSYSVNLCATHSDMKTLVYHIRAK